MRLVLLLTGVAGLFVGSFGASAADCDNLEFFETATPRAVQECLSAGADVNARDSRGWTPLHITAGWNEHPAGAALSEQEGIVGAPEAIGCGSPGDFSRIAFEAFRGDQDQARREFAARLLSGACVPIADWHYTVLGRIGQYRRYTAILGGPKNGSVDVWYTFNEWLIE